MPLSRPCVLRGDLSSGRITRYQGRTVLRGCSARRPEAFAEPLTTSQVIPGHVHPYAYTVEEATPQNMAFIRLQGPACQPYLTVRCVRTGCVP